MVATRKNKSLEEYLEQLDDLLEKVDSLSSSGKKCQLIQGRQKRMQEVAPLTRLLEVMQEVNWPHPSTPRGFPKYSRTCGPDRKWPFFSIAKSDKS